MKECTYNMKIKIMSQVKNELEYWFRQRMQWAPINIAKVYFTNHYSKLFLISLCLLARDFISEKL